MNALCSQDEDDYIEHDPQMLEDLQQTMVKAGLDKLFDGTNQNIGTNLQLVIVVFEPRSQ